MKQLASPLCVEQRDFPGVERGRPGFQVKRKAPMSYRSCSVALYFRIVLRARAD